MKILLTGATGFVGSYLAHKFVQKEHHVVGITRRNLNSNIQSILMCDNFHLAQADLSEGFSFPKEVDAIVHTAAQSPAPGVSVDDYIKNNVVAFQNLIKYACKIGVSKFIQLSSISLYGEVKTKVIDEETPIVNPSPYGMTKYLGELLLRDNIKNFPSVALRLPGVLGRGAQTPWLANVLNLALQGKDVTVYNPDAYFNNVVYLSDLYNIIETILNQNLNGFEAVTLGCAQPLTIEETVGFLIEQLKSSSKIIEGKNSRISFTISTEKARRLFGYDPLPLTEILRKYCSESVK